MNSKPSSYVRLLPLLLLAACARVSTPQPRCASLGFTSFTLVGAVREEESGQLLSATTIRVLGSSRVAVTDSSGAYRIPRLPLGTHVVEASRVGYYREKREVGVYDGDVLRLCDSDTTAVLRFYMRPQRLP